MIIVTDMMGLFVAGILNAIILFVFFVFRDHMNEHKWFSQVRDVGLVGVAYAGLVFIQIFIQIVLLKIWGPATVYYHVMAASICLVYGLVFIIGSFFIFPNVKNTITFIAVVISYVLIIYLGLDVLKNDILTLLLAMLIGMIVSIVLSVVGKIIKADDDSWLNKPYWDLSNVLTPKVLLIILVVLWFVGAAETICRFEGYTVWWYLANL